jgi:uncharacterized membrane protein SpoIIM required for sporulation
MSAIHPFRLTTSTSTVLIWHVAVLGLSVGSGWVAHAIRPNVAVPAVVRSVPDALSQGDRAVYIASQNLKLLALVVCGAVSFGLLSVVALAWNGYVLGFGLATVWSVAPESLALLARYVPLEFGAFVLGSTAAHVLCLRVVRALFLSEPVALTPAVALVFMACGLIVAAAVIEADVASATADCGLRTADCGLRTADCGRRTADCGVGATVP